MTFSQPELDTYPEPDSNDSIVIHGNTYIKSRIEQWPTEFSDCWIAIHKDGTLIRALLVDNQDHPEGSVITVTEEPQTFMACAAWDILFRFKFIWVAEGHRGQKLGFAMARWSWIWVALTEGKEMKMPREDSRSDEAVYWIDYAQTVFGISGNVI